MDTPNGAADLLSSTPDHDHTSPPLQLPKVGWDDDDDDDQMPTDPPEAQPIPSSYRSASSLSLRYPTRSSELELQPIPEDMSMHGPWPDFCINYYDYEEDRKKAYRYRMCGRFTCRSGLVTVICFLLLLVAVVKFGPAAFLTAGGGSGGAGLSTKLTQEQAQLYEKVASSLHPLWYDRSRGWNGTAYLQAYDFCARLPTGDHERDKSGRVPCPYVAYCPLGRGYAPYGGVRSDGEGWAPVLERENEWVQVGSSNTCELYSNLHDEPPRWGFTGENDEAITQNIMCCLKPSSHSQNDNSEEEEEAVYSDVLHIPPDLEEDEQDKEGAESTASTTEQSTSNEAATESTNRIPTTQQSPMNNQPTAPQLPNEDFQRLVSFFEPVWFDRTYGISFTQDSSSAQDFCYNKAGKRSICPYVAYCPEGPAGRVMEGHDPSIKIEWAPMKEWNGFRWVGIGVDNSCWQAEDASQFGIEEDDALAVDEVLGYIMCCKEKEEVDP